MDGVWGLRYLVYLKMGVLTTDVFGAFGELIDIYGSPPPSGGEMYYFNI